MKKLLFLGLALVICTSCFSQFKFKGVGAGAAIGSKASKDNDGNKTGYGIAIKGLFQITKLIDAEASFNYYKPSSYSDWYFPLSFNNDFNLITINLDGHLNFIRSEKFTAFGLVGLNRTSTNLFVVGGGSSATFRDSNFGVNLGTGAYWGLTKVINLTSEAGYTLGAGDYSQLFLNIGILYKF